MKFSIRDLFLATMIVALAVGWAVDHWRQARESERAKRSAETLNKINDEFSGQLGEKGDTIEALKAALDETCPGWRDTNGSYTTLVKPGGRKRIVLPKSSAPAPNPPKP